MGTDQALKEYPEIFKKYFGTIVPPEDNKFAALNSAVWSGGSFVYVPKGVEVPLPLQAYFRINGENTGQFERTLIVVDEGAKVHYIEGCTAPIYATDSLHAAVVEVVALPGSKVRYTTIQNWSNDVYNLVTKRAHAYENSHGRVDRRQHRLAQDRQVPGIYLRGEGATADIISVAVAGKGQHQDTGAKAIHLAPNTRSRIVSKSVSKDGGRATYRGQLKVAPGATNVVASVRCDALMLDDQSRSDTYPYIDIQEDDTTMTHEATVGKISADQVFYLMSRGLTENEATEPHRPGLPRGVHQGTADGVRHRVQPPGEAGDGRVPRLTAPASRPRPARRALDDLSLPVERADVDELHLIQGLARLVPRRSCVGVRRVCLAAGGIEPPVHALYRSSAGAPRDRASRLGPGDGARRPRDLPEDADGLLLLSEGGVIGSALSDAAQDAGVEFTTFADLHGRKPDAARELLEGGPGLPADDKFAQLTRALWSQCVVLDIPAGVTLAKPIVVRWALGAADRALITRTLVRLGAGAKASIVEELVPVDDVDDAAAQSFFAGTMEVTVGDGASLQVASLQELPANVVAIQHRAANVGEGATLQWALAQLGGRLVRSRVENRLVGDRSSVEQVEIVFGADEQLFDLTSYTTHVGKNTTGDLLSKAALLEKSRTYLKGLITIERSANGTDSFLGEFGMNLSKDARSVAIPSLEIDQPDCRRAMHSSSVGPVDETQLFYLESRGIPPDEARKFIVLGFLEPVVARVPLASAQDRLRELLEAKWIAGTDGVAGEAAA